MYLHILIKVKIFNFNEIFKFKITDEEYKEINREIVTTVATTMMDIATNASEPFYKEMNSIANEKSISKSEAK